MKLTKIIIHMQKNDNREKKADSIIFNPKPITDTKNFSMMLFLQSCS